MKTTRLNVEIEISDVHELLNELLDEIAVIPVYYDGDYYKETKRIKLIEGVDLWLAISVYVCGMSAEEPHGYCNVDISIKTHEDLYCVFDWDYSDELCALLDKLQNDIEKEIYNDIDWKKE